MDVSQFEQAILKLAFETDARITTASVAYYLGLPSRRCNELLNQLLSEGVLELDSDPEGNLYYRVPNKPAGSDAVLGRLRREREFPFAAANRLLSEAPGAWEESAQTALVPSTPARRQIEGIAWVGPNDQGDAPPLSPRLLAPAAPPPQMPEAGVDSSAAPGPGWDYIAADAAPSAPPRPRRPRRASRDEIFAGILRHQAPPDASINRCGQSPLLLAEAVRCDPRPLAARKPVLVRCAEPTQAEATQRAADAFFHPQADQWPVLANGARAQTWASQSWSAQPGALAATGGGEMALRSDAIAQPEHQPGMALLLSLILCGTGQIYNGEVSKGIMMMVLCFLLWFVLLGWVVHIWSIVDSVVVAERLNRTGS